MAKTSSPIRVDKNLMEQASIVAEQTNRSTVGQLEEWAWIGRDVAMSLSQNDIMAVKAGVKKIVLMEAIPEADSYSIMKAFRNQLQSGSIKEQLLSSGPKYQASQSRPGLLDQVHSDGTVLTGMFKGGEFIEIGTTQDDASPLIKSARPNPGGHIVEEDSNNETTKAAVGDSWQ